MSRSEVGFDKPRCRRWTEKFFKACCMAIAVILGFMTANLIENHKSQIGRIKVVPLPESVEIRGRLKNASMKPQRPVIGILSQIILHDYATETPKSLHGLGARYGNSYIPASYARFIQAAGATVVPIPNDLPEDDLRNIFDSINGIVFPGGARTIPQSMYYTTAGKLIKWAMEANDSGDYFPVWGICLGFQFMTNFFLNSNRTVDQHEDLRGHCRAYDLSLPFRPTQSSESSRMLAKISRPLYEDIQKEPSVYYFHTKCFTIDQLQRSGVLQKINVVGKSFDLDGKEYASMTEHKKYPFYGTQFHPEKLMFEWNPIINIFRPQSGIVFSQTLLNFFMSEVAKNRHSFKNPTVVNKIDIENYPCIHTMLLHKTHLQAYYFLNDNSFGKPVIDYRLDQQKFDFMVQLALGNASLTQILGINT
ncbi:gamma-glutamyl hydrolase-like [Bolinopsis microptera]|uniref:gamma-glutamyl hydrolase-like n=1 Tax=Bolinopsis microptera TaxID=2820187 RepID=UPI0030795E63